MKKVRGNHSCDCGTNWKIFQVLKYTLTMIKTFPNEFKSLNSSLVNFYPKVGIIDVET